MATRAERNHNPGNLTYVEGQAKWEGQVGLDGRFVRFSADQWGVRAMVRTLMAYRDRHGLQNIRAIVSRWAPPQENDTETYIDNVSSWVGVPPDEPLEWTYEQWKSLVRAIGRQEGYEPPEKAVVAGLRLAGVPTRRSGGLTQSRTLRNAAGAISFGTISLGTLLNSVVGQISSVDWRVAVAIVAGGLAVLLTAWIIKYRVEDERDWNP